METDGVRTVVRVTVAPTVNTTTCTGCGRCVAACPLRLITLEVTGFHKTAVLSNVDRCTSCGQCVASCLIDAMTKK